VPGIRKHRLAELVSQSLASVGADVSGHFDDSGGLPWLCTLRYRGSTWTYRMYFWLVSHGGRTRSASEYRIQAKLPGSLRHLSFGGELTALLGYYSRDHDYAGPDLGNDVPRGMEVFVAWDAPSHLRVGASSSCQVRLQTLRDGFVSGASAQHRRLGNGQEEAVYAFRRDRLVNYLCALPRGHNALDVSLLKQGVA
jgi:hypothetical protein